MIGAGLIKIRGDKCWTDLTCMNYHYEVIKLIRYYLALINLFHLL